MSGLKDGFIPRPNIWLILWYGINLSFQLLKISIFIWREANKTTSEIDEGHSFVLLYLVCSPCSHICIIVVLLIYSWMQGWLFHIFGHGGAFFRWNVSAGAARPNPQGSFIYGQITVTDVYVILNRPPEMGSGGLPSMVFRTYHLQHPWHLPSSSTFQGCTS